MILILKESTTLLELELTPAPGTRNQEANLLLLLDDKDKEDKDKEHHSVVTGKQPRKKPGPGWMIRLASHISIRCECRY